MAPPSTKARLLRLLGITEGAQTSDTATANGGLERELTSRRELKVVDWPRCTLLER